MKMLIVGVSAISALAATIALADDTTLINEMNMKPLSRSQSMQLRSERDAATEQWAKMTPAERDAVKKAAMEKKTGDLSAIERVGQNDDLMAMTKSESSRRRPRAKRRRPSGDRCRPASRTRSGRPRSKSG